VFVGLPGSMNDSWVLKKSGLYQRVVNGGLLSGHLHHTGNIAPYILGDKGYPLLPTKSNTVEVNRLLKTCLEF
jgi:hypothetical protein